MISIYIYNPYDQGFADLGCFAFLFLKIYFLDENILFVGLIDYYSDIPTT